MSRGTRLQRRRASRVLTWAGALLVLSIAAGLFSRYGIEGNLSRDESIYAYGGQQFAEGVPPYASIFDPKTPLATILAGVGALAAKAVGGDELHAIRIVFFLFACAGAVAVYLLVLWLWQSPPAALAGAAVFASFRGFALDALAGPDAKTPGVFFAVLAMALLVRRRWFWGAFTGSLAFLVWQPLAIYPLLAVVGAGVRSHAGRRRSACVHALAGAAIPVAATTLYFLLAGALPKFVEAAFVFPVTGLERGKETFGQRLDDIVTTVHDSYGPSGVLLWAGLVLLLALLVLHVARGRADLRRALAHPFVSVVVASFAVLAGYSLIDFQGYPDVYPLLPYGAVGWGGTAAVVAGAFAGRRVRAATTAGALAAVAALAGLSWSWFSNDPPLQPDLELQQARATALERTIGPGGTMYALGNPVPLVLTERRNPSRFVYLSSGVGHWVIEHTPGGILGWAARIRGARPGVVVLAGWPSPREPELEGLLRPYFDETRLGSWLVLVAPELRARAKADGLAVR